MTRKRQGTEMTRGFSMIELLIVMIVLGIISVFAIPQGLIAVHAPAAVRTRGDPPVVMVTTYKSEL